jgi:sec-independent protein translocase protein TatA
MGRAVAAFVRASSGATVMGTFSLTHWLVVLAIVLVLFGAGRIPKAMGDMARGIRAFRTGMREENATEPETDKLVDAHPSDQQRG